MITSRRFSKPRSSLAADKRPPLIEYFILSMLLHFLLVLLFGNPAGDGSSRGQKLFGAFNVTLNSGLRDLLSSMGSETGIKLETESSSSPSHRSDNAPVTYKVPVTIEGKSVLDAAPTLPSNPETNVRPLASKSAAVANPEKAPETAPVNEVTPPVTKDASKPDSRFVAPPSGLTIRPAPEKAATPAINSRPQENPTVPSPHPAVLVSPKIERFVVPPPMPAKPDETPAGQSPVPEPLTPPAKIEPVLIPPAVELKVERKPESRAVEPSSEVQALLPAPKSVPVDTPIRFETPAIELKTRENLRGLPAVPSPPLEPVVLPKIEQPVVPPPLEPKSREVPVDTSLKPLIPPKIERAVTPIVPPAIVSPVTPTAPPNSAPAIEQKPRELPPATPVTPAAPDTSLERSMQPAAPAARVPTPALAVPATAGTQAQGNKPQGDQLAAPANPAASPATPPGFNLDNLRNQARDLGRQGSSSSRSGLFQLQAPPVIEERKSDLAKALEKAATPDCRDAYTGMGLAAVVPLAASTLRNKGCKW